MYQFFIHVIFVFVCLLIVYWKGYHFLYIWWFTESKWSCSFKRSIYYMTFDFYMIVFLDQYETLSSPQVRVTSLLLCKMAQFGKIYDVSAINLSCIYIYPLNEFSAKGQFHNCVTWVIVLNYQEQCWGEESVAN